MPTRRPEDLTLDEWRAIGERFADEYAAADRADAPLFAKQQAEATMRENGLLAPDQHLRWRDDGTLEVVPTTGAQVSVPVADDAARTTADGNTARSETTHGRAPDRHESGADRKRRKRDETLARRRARNARVHTDGATTKSARRSEARPDAARSIHTQPSRSGSRRSPLRSVVRRIFPRALSAIGIVAALIAIIRLVSRIRGTPEPPEVRQDQYEYPVSRQARNVQQPRPSPESTCEAEFAPGSGRVSLGTCPYGGPGIYQFELQCPDGTGEMGALWLRSEVQAVLFYGLPFCTDTRPVSQTQRMSLLMLPHQVFGHVSAVRDGIVHITFDRTLNPSEEILSPYFLVYRETAGARPSAVGEMSIHFGTYLSPIGTHDDSLATGATGIMIDCPNGSLPRPGDVVICATEAVDQPEGHLVPIRTRRCVQYLHERGQLGQQATGMYLQAEVEFWGFAIAREHRSTELADEVATIQRRAPEFGASAAACANTALVDLHARLSDIDAAERDEQAAIEDRAYDRYSAARRHVLALNNQIEQIITRALDCLGPDARRRLFPEDAGFRSDAP